MLFLTMPTLPKVFGFYHVCLVNNWGGIVRDQIELILKSGLYDRTYKIFVSCLGTVTQRKHLEKMLPPKFKIVFFNEDIKLAEIPIIQYMQDLSKTDEFILWYIHTKGVISGVRNSNVVSWRRLMEHFIIQRHKNCIKLISESKCDACGVLVNGTLTCGHFFAGNFWWSKSGFIKKLPSIMNIFIASKRTNRWIAEFLFSSSHTGHVPNRRARFYSFFQRSLARIEELYANPVRIEDYIHTNHIIKIPFVLKVL